MSRSDVKLADLGSIKEKKFAPHTEYVSTRWYRAPELALKSKNYTDAADIFAVGCIFAELVTMKPLFTSSSEIDQLQKIIAFLGTPTNWKEG